MRFVVHPSFVRRKAVLFGSLTGSAFLGLIVAGFGSYFRPSLLWAGEHPACLVVLKETLSPTLSAVQGYQDEQAVLKKLETLPNDYIGITNLVLPSSKRGDIDIVLLGPMGVLVIEVKAYSGHIRYEKGRWWKVQKNGWKTAFKSVSGQAKGNGRELEAFLHSKGHSCRVGSVLVFVGTEQLDVETLKMPVVMTEALMPFISQLPLRMAQQDVEQFASLLSTQRILQPAR